MSYTVNFILPIFAPPNLITYSSLINYLISEIQYQLPLLSSNRLIIGYNWSKSKVPKSLLTQVNSYAIISISHKLSRNFML